MTLYVVATDRFLSGWGEAPRRSLFAAKCETDEQVSVAERNFRKRPEFRRVRICLKPPRVRAGDNLRIVTPEEDPVWFRS